MNENCNVAKLFKAFDYEQMMICEHDKNDLRSFTVHKIPKRWLSSLQKELCRMAGMQIDNKQGFIFQMEGENLVTAMTFWDTNIKYIQWKAIDWDGDTPHNLVCSFGDNMGRRRPTSAKELGL